MITVRRFFYDTEFIEDGVTIDLVSIGVVDEAGRAHELDADGHASIMGHHRRAVVRGAAGGRARR